MDENHNVVAFGKEAKQVYMNVPLMRDKWMLFERFKMSLYQVHADADEYKERNIE